MSSDKDHHTSIAASFSRRASSMHGLTIFCMLKRNFLRRQQQPISLFNCNTNYYLIIICKYTHIYIFFIHFFKLFYLPWCTGSEEMPFFTYNQQSYYDVLLLYLQQLTSKHVTLYTYIQDVRFTPAIILIF